MNPVRPERLPVPPAELGEGPRWFAARLHWVDLVAGLIHRWDPLLEQTVSEEHGDAVSLVLPRRNGGEVQTIGADVQFIDPDGSRCSVVQLGEPEMRCNDGGCGPDGSLYVGTMRRDGTGRQGRLHRIDAGGGVDVVLGDLGVSNGIAFDPGRGRTYFVDSMDHRIDLLDIASGRRTTFVEIDPADGLPDGLTIDDAGGVWVALHGGFQVRRYSPERTLDRVVAVPAPLVTACTFGGPTMTDLFITTAREGLDEEALADHPLSGSVFRLPNAGTGMPLFAFAG